MARGFEHQRTNFRPNGFNVTGGTTTSAGSMANAGTLNTTFGAQRKKTSSINEIPSLGLALGAKIYEADKYAEMMENKAENDSKIYENSYGMKADAISQQGQDAMMKGLFGGFAGPAISLFRG